MGRLTRDKAASSPLNAVGLHALIESGHSPNNGLMNSSQSTAQASPEADFFSSTGLSCLRVALMTLLMLSISACGDLFEEDDVDPLVARGNGDEIRQSVATNSAVQSTAAPEDDFAELSLKAINEARAEGQICGDEYYAPAGAVLWNDQVAHAALLESEWMQQNNEFSHAWHDGTRVGDRLDMASYNWRHADENIAAGFRNIPDVIQGWIDSPSHCRALMRPDVSETGVAVVPGEIGNDYVSYWTMIVAQPANKEYIDPSNWKRAH